MTAFCFLGLPCRQQLARQFSQRLSPRNVSNTPNPSLPFFLHQLPCCLHQIRNGPTLTLYLKMPPPFHFIHFADFPVDFNSSSLICSPGTAPFLSNLTSSESHEVPFATSGNSSTNIEFARNPALVSTAPFSSATHGSSIFTTSSNSKVSSSSSFPFPSVAAAFPTNGLLCVST
jgi:hypothetical protein